MVSCAPIARFVLVLLNLLLFVSMNIVEVALNVTSDLIMFSVHICSPVVSNIVPNTVLFPYKQQSTFV